MATVCVPRHPSDLGILQVEIGVALSSKRNAMTAPFNVKKGTVCYILPSLAISISVSTFNSKMKTRYRYINNHDVHA